MAERIGVPLEVARRGREVAKGREAVRFKREGGKVESVGDDPTRAQVRTTGGVNWEFSRQLLAQVGIATASAPGASGSFEADLETANAIFGFMHEMQPRSPAEAILLSQIGVLQAHFAKAMGIASASLSKPERYALYSKQGIALARTCATLMTTLQGLRGEGGQQKVVVERVNVAPGGVGVGVIEHGGEGGARS